MKASTGSLGAQNALGGGGRYDAMIHELGGPAVPALGFAIGLDRVLLAMGEQARRTARPDVLHRAHRRAGDHHRACRSRVTFARAGVRVDVDGRGASVKAMLRRANGIGARVCVLIGDSELDRGIVKVKDLTLHTESEELAR